MNSILNTRGEYALCTRCGVQKSSKEFYRDNSKTEGITKMCIRCVKVHHSKHPLYAQFIKDRKILLHAGNIIEEINTIEKAELYAKSNNLFLDIVDNVKKLFNE